MTFDPGRERFKAARAAGIGEVCATCRKYWEGVEQRTVVGLDPYRGKCSTKEPCGGPIAGDDFSQYDGPIRDFAQRCFVCGRTSDLAIEVVGRPRRIGVCDAHLHLVYELRAQRDVGPITLVSGPEQKPIVLHHKPGLVETMQADLAEAQEAFTKRYG